MTPKAKQLGASQIERQTMTNDRSDWAAKLPFVQAFVEGKEVEELFPHAWLSITETCSFARNSDCYRLKPEPEVLCLNINNRQAYTTSEMNNEIESYGYDKTDFKKFMEAIE